MLEMGTLAFVAMLQVKKRLTWGSEFKRVLTTRPQQYWDVNSVFNFFSFNAKGGNT